MEKIFLPFARTVSRGNGQEFNYTSQENIFTDFHIKLYNNSVWENVIFSQRTIVKHVNITHKKLLS